MRPETNSFLGTFEARLRALRDEVGTALCNRDDTIAEEKYAKAEAIAERDRLKVQIDHMAKGMADMQKLINQLHDASALVSLPPGAVLMPEHFKPGTKVYYRHPGTKCVTMLEVRSVSVRILSGGHMDVYYNLNGTNNTNIAGTCVFATMEEAFKP